MALPAPPVVRNDVTCDSLRPWALERKVGPEGKLGGGAREPPPMQLPWPFVEVLLPQAHGGEAVQVHLGRLQLCRARKQILDTHYRKHKGEYATALAILSSQYAGKLANFHS